MEVNFLYQNYSSWGRNRKKIGHFVLPLATLLDIGQVGGEIEAL